MPTDNWLCPAGVTQVWVECWGSGSDGGTAPLGSGNSGGGGSYARGQVVVIPGNLYPVQWGPGGTNVQTVFGTNDVVAIPCVASIPGADGTAGTGSVKFSGGDGLAGQFTDISNPFPGRGGGSSAGRNADGTDSAGQSGAVISGGGTGGDGGNPGQADTNPTTTATSGSPAGPGPGGGGGGCGWNVFQAVNGGAGEEGGLLIYNNTDASPFVADPDIVVGTFGENPPFPAPDPAKLAKRSFMM